MTKQVLYNINLRPNFIINTLNIWARPWENVTCHMRTTKAQIRLPLCSSLLRWYNISRFYSQNFKTLASVAAQAGLCLAWSETPEDTFCRVMAHILITNHFNFVYYPKLLQSCLHNNEPQHDKTNKMTCTQQQLIILDICQVWSVFAVNFMGSSAPKASLYGQWKSLIKLGGCPGWSESSLGAQVILLVLSCSGSYFYSYKATKHV